jgi:hypothetical protein
VICCCICGLGWHDCLPSPAFTISACQKASSTSIFHRTTTYVLVAAIKNLQRPSLLHCGNGILPGRCRVALFVLAVMQNTSGIVVTRSPAPSLSLFFGEIIQQLHYAFHHSLHLYHVKLVPIRSYTNRVPPTPHPADNRPAHSLPSTTAKVPATTWLGPRGPPAVGDPGTQGVGARYWPSPKHGAHRPSCSALVQCRHAAP